MAIKKLNPIRGIIMKTKIIALGLILTTSMCLLSNTSFGMQQSYDDWPNYNYSTIVKTSKNIRSDEGQYLDGHQTFLDYLKDIYKKEGKEGLCVYGRMKFTLLIVAVDENCLQSVCFLMLFPKVKRRLINYPPLKWIGCVSPPITTALFQGKFDITKILIENGAIVNFFDLDQWITEYLLKSKNEPKKKELLKNIKKFKSWYINSYGWGKNLKKKLLNKQAKKQLIDIEIKFFNKKTKYEDK